MIHKTICRSLVAAAAFIAPLSIAHAQTHVFQLNGTGPSGYCDQFNSLVCLTPLGGSLTGTGYATGNGTGQHGLSLSNVFNSGTYTVGGAYTIVMRSYVNDIHSGSTYQKLVDFKNFGTAAGIYAANDCAGDPNCVGNDGTPYYQASDTPNSDEYGIASAYQSLTLQTSIFTYDGAGYFTAYLDGANQWSTGTHIGTPAGDFDFSGPNAIANFMSSNVDGDQTTGFVDYIAIYDHTVCTNDSGACSYSLVAPVTTPEPASLALLGTGLMGIVGVARRRRTGK